MKVVLLNIVFEICDNLDKPLFLEYYGKCKSSIFGHFFLSDNIVKCVEMLVNLSMFGSDDCSPIIGL